jgi:putative hydrolase of the HAD superfamily
MHETRVARIGRQVQPAAATVRGMGVRAVLFDLGGVVLGSPLHAIARHEHERGLPAGFVNRVVMSTGPSGAWSRLERGELPMDAFYAAFEADCAAAGEQIDARTMMREMHEATLPRPEMLEAIRRLRAHGLRTGAVTNNWPGEQDGTRALRLHFDVFVESCVEGIRKPDPRIYALACERIGAAPSEAAFLDDIGVNLKSARAFGLHTIKVDSPVPALRALGMLIGLSLVDDPADAQRR